MWDTSFLVWAMRAIGCLAPNSGIAALLKGDVGASYFPYLVGDMMKITRIAAWAVITASVSIGLGHAQSLRDAQTPAEFPPASFNGTQYVDSRGCVYVRAGIDGNVTWVPRVNRQRQLICGQTPSLSAEAAAAARVTPSQSARTTPEQITIAPSSAETVTTGQPAQRPTVRTTQTTPTPPRQPTQRVVVRRPAQAAAPVTQTTRTSATQAPPVRPVASQGTARRGSVVTARREEKEFGPETRVVPLHVYNNRLAQRPARLPKGYRPIWEDDRLNPRRAEQSLNGIAQTRLVWTRTVPRRLMDRQTGRDVTATVPLVYPYVDVATQERDLGTVTLIRRDGQIVKRVQRKSRAKARQPVASTRSASRPAPKQAVTGRYVQVGMFGVPANAQAAAQRIARAGLPARIGNIKRGSRSYQIVLAGPFGSSSDLSKGLQRSRAVGFSDAFVRR